MSVPEWGPTKIVDDLGPEYALDQDTTPRETVAGTIQDGMIFAPEIGSVWERASSDDEQQ